MEINFILYSAKCHRIHLYKRPEIHTSLKNLQDYIQSNRNLVKACDEEYWTMHTTSSFLCLTRRCMQHNVTLVRDLGVRFLESFKDYGFVNLFIWTSLCWSSRWIAKSRLLSWKTSHCFIKCQDAHSCWISSVGPMTTVLPEYSVCCTRGYTNDSNKHVLAARCLL